MAVGRSQLLGGWPGTLSRILSGIQLTAQTVLGVYLKRDEASYWSRSLESDATVRANYALTTTTT